MASRECDSQKNVASHNREQLQIIKDRVRQIEPARRIVDLRLLVSPAMIVFLLLSEPRPFDPSHEKPCRRHSSFTGMPVSASRRKPMICSSVNRFFTSNLLRMGDWTPNHGATQKWGTSKKSRFIEEQIIPILKEMEAGEKVEDQAVSEHWWGAAFGIFKRHLCCLLLLLVKRAYQAPKKSPQTTRVQTQRPRRMFREAR
jgi:hypothetical protein